MISKFLQIVAVVGALVLSTASIRGQSIDEAEVFGSFVYFKSLPEVLFLVGEIKEGDFFQLRKSMRAYSPKLVVLSSPGGSVYEALQLATAIHDTGMATFVPKGGNCASACAFIFFGGIDRQISGQLGVHQFYAAGDSSTEKIDKAEGLKAAQFTTSEIIGFLNEFETPPFVYEQMFSTIGMHYFTEPEVSKLSIGGNDPDLANLRGSSQEFFNKMIAEANADLAPPDAPAASNANTSSAPVAPPPPAFKTYSDADLFGGDLLKSGVRDISLGACENICQSNHACRAYTYILAKKWCWPKASVGSLSAKTGAISGIKSDEIPDTALYTQAQELLLSVNNVWSLPNAASLLQLPDFYLGSTKFYGTWMTRDEVMAEKAKFAQRWPVRRYAVEPDSVSVYCGENACTIDAIISWVAEAPERGARSSGRSTWNLVLLADGQKLRIESESGKVIGRN